MIGLQREPNKREVVTQFRKTDKKRGFMVLSEEAVTVIVINAGK